ncbi:MAG: ACP S-malonyltransferase [Holosporaceae bacterium]|nr:ACP S-malonyltransferase [Holosporaceae bacterium]
MIFVFPGQGSQKVGMGKDLYDAFSSAKNIFHEVDDSISFKLSDLIFNGAEDELKSTENAQPALMAVSMAFVKVLEEEFHLDVSQKARFLAGHSLGEYVALCADRVISVADAAKILRTRGAAMASACPTGGAMAAILGLDLETVEQILSECRSKDEIVQIANDNSVGQIVISGHEQTVKKAVEKAISAGAKKSVPLEVSGPFHCKLMENAVAKISEILERTKFYNPIKPIISNVTAKAETDNFKELLRKQITERVRWRESVLFAESNSASKCVEIGPGKVLSGLVKRISPNIEPINVNSIESLENFAKSLA